MKYAEVAVNVGRLVENLIITDFKQQLSHQPPLLHQTLHLPTKSASNIFLSYMRR